MAAQQLPTVGIGNIANVHKFLSDVTAEEVFQFPAETAQHLWRLFNSPRVTTPGKTFSDLFSDHAISHYRNPNGKPLRGGRRLGYWHKKGNITQGSLGRQRAFLRDKTLANCRRKLSNILFSRKVFMGKYDCLLIESPRGTRNFLASIMPSLADEFGVSIVRANTCIEQISNPTAWSLPAPSLDGAFFIQKPTFPILTNRATILLTVWYQTIFVTS